MPGTHSESVANPRGADVTRWLYRAQLVGERFSLAWRLRGVAKVIPSPAVLERTAGIRGEAVEMPAVRSGCVANRSGRQSRGRVLNAERERECSQG